MTKLQYFLSIVFTVFKTDANNLTVHMVLFVHWRFPTPPKDDVRQRSSEPQRRFRWSLAHVIAWSKWHGFFCTLGVILLWSDNKCRHSLCAFPNMVSNVNTMRKSGKNQEKKERHDVKLLIMLRYSLHGLCAFTSMVIKVNIARKSN